MNKEEISIKAERIRDVIRYIKRFKNAAVVICIQNEVIDSPLFSNHIHDIALLHESGLRICIVPSARTRIDEVLSSYRVSWYMHQGLRITAEEAMPLIKMAAFDVANKVMTCLAAEKISAVIGNWVHARGIGVVDGVDHMTGGEIERIRFDAIQTVINDGFVPIFPCIGWSSSGKPYNISSIKLAASIAEGMKADKLFFLSADTSITPEFFVVPPEIGLSSENCVPALNLEELADFLKTNPITEKNRITLELLQVAHKAVSGGVSRAHILNASYDGTIPCEIFSDLGSGTMIYKNNYGGIRTMQLQDIPPVMALIAPFVEKGILLARSEEQLIRQLNDFIVYEIDGGIRACAALHIYECSALKNGDISSIKEGEIAAVAVDESYSHMGIGPKLMTFLIERAKLQALSSVFVLTTQTADWFERLGFITSDILSLPEQRKAYWDPKRSSKLLRLSLSYSL